MTETSTTALFLCRKHSVTEYNLDNILDVHLHTLIYLPSSNFSFYYRLNVKMIDGSGDNDQLTQWLNSPSYNPFKIPTNCDMFAIRDQALSFFLTTLRVKKPNYSSKNHVKEGETNRLMWLFLIQK